MSLQDNLGRVVAGVFSSGGDEHELLVLAEDLPQAAVQVAPGVEVAAAFPVLLPPSKSAPGQFQDPPVLAGEQQLGLLGVAMQGRETVIEEEDEEIVTEVLAGVRLFRGGQGLQDVCGASGG